MTSVTDRVYEFLRSRGTTRLRDVKAAKLPVGAVYRLLARGRIERVGPGTYECAEAATGEYHDLVAVARRVPRGVVCLFSALQFHELTTQLPVQTWIALPGKARVPKGLGRGVRVVRFYVRRYDDGVEVHTLEGVPVRVYSPAKTVADCFNYRSVIGTDVAVEALRDTVRKGKATPGQIAAAAAAVGMGRVMAPYLEAVV